MRKAILVILPVIFTAQACNFLFGGLYGDQGSGNQGVFRSTDSGDTWQEANQISKKESLLGIMINRVVVESGDPSNLLAAGQTGGLYGSDNHAQTWIKLLPNFAVKDAFVNPVNNNEIFASGDVSKVGAIYKSSDRAGTWVKIYGDSAGPSSVTALAPDTQNPKNILAGLSKGGVLQSKDGGQTWQSVTNLKDRVVRLAIGFDTARTIFALLRTEGLSRSSDGGKTWSKISITTGEPKTFYDLALDKKDPTKFYLATDKGLLATTDSGKSWARLSLPGDPALAQVTAVAVSPDTGQQIFAAVRSTVYRSDDGGSTWHTASLSTNRVITTLAINPLEPNRIYAGVK